MICVHGLICKQKLQEAHLEGCSINDYLSLFFSHKKYISISKEKKCQNQEHKKFGSAARAA
jgi:hypothetical protein